MSSSNNMLGPGDSIFHPKYGFGAIASLTQRSRSHPIPGPTVGAQTAHPDTDHPEEAYYDIQLMEGGTLLVPVDRAESVGLRRLSNGLAAIKADLCSPPRSLPTNPRERAAILRTRELLAEPGALACSVRDMLAQSRGRTLSAGEKTWLDKSCQRLSTEAALVDHIPVFEARAAIWDIVHQLSVTQSVA
jgi:RNA polymerase-interacting CarD/CdnL/TRCF family regulator